MHGHIRENAKPYASEERTNPRGKNNTVLRKLKKKKIITNAAAFDLIQRCPISKI